MSRIVQALCAAGLLMVVSVGCGGGNSAPVPPIRPAATSVASPLPANPTAIGTATLTIALPNVLTAALSASGTAASKRRSPAYVNPSTIAVLDIYVDGYLIPNIDGLAGTGDSLKIVATSSGVQTASIPLYSPSANDIVVLEWDSSSHNEMLAVGEYDAGTFTPGTTVTATVSMQMSARYLGIVDLPNESSPSLMSGTWSHQLLCGGAGSTAEFGVYPADALGSFVAAAGYGGTSAATITSATSTGTTTVGQTTIPGVWRITWDAGCHSITISASAPNPAYAIYNDVTNVNYLNYYDAFYYGYFGSNYAAGGHQGIWNMYYFLVPQNNEFVYSGLLQAGTQGPTASGTITVTGMGP